MRTLVSNPTPTPSIEASMRKQKGRATPSFRRSVLTNAQLLSAAYLRCGMRGEYPTLHHTTARECHAQLAVLGDGRAHSPQPTAWREELHVEDALVHFLRTSLSPPRVPSQPMLLDPLLLHVVGAVHHALHSLKPPLFAGWASVVRIDEARVRTLVHELA